MFNKLTVRLPDEPIYIPDENKWSVTDEFGAKCLIGEVVDRLAAYEDSGLSPEEVQELKVSVKICEDCWNHAQAKAEGRLVVLPVKVGDRVYSIYGYLNKSIQEDTVKHICVQDGEIRLTMDNTCTKIWERSAFATREEAEKVLQEGLG
jgi:hypothetical protein